LALEIKKLEENSRRGKKYVIRNTINNAQKNKNGNERKQKTESKKKHIVD